MKQGRVIAIILLMLGCANLQAQQIAVGARGGISIPNLSSSGSDQNPLNTGYISRLGPRISWKSRSPNAGRLHAYQSLSSLQQLSWEEIH
jgi:hypothetical protein